jgi:hypothetical protein
MSEGLMERLTEGDISDRHIRNGSLPVVQEVELGGVTMSTEMQKTESRQFVRVDELLARKAGEFYGKAPYNITDMARFRLFRKAVGLVMKPDNDLWEWRRQFDTVKTMAIGQKYYDAPIIYHNDDGSSGSTTAKQALKRPGVQAMVLEGLDPTDPVAHIVTTLKKWPETNEQSLSENDIAGAHRALNLFLLSVRGPQIMEELSRLTNAPRETSSTESSVVE